MLKFLTLSLFCVTLLACSPSPELPTNIDEAKHTIIKRWLQSPKHCQGLLDDRLSDFTLMQDGINFGGLSVKGSYSFYDNEDAQRYFSDFLKGNRNCSRTLPESNAPFRMIQFSTYEQRFILAVFEGQQFMLRLVDNEVFPVIPFPDGSDYLRKLNYEN